MPQPSDIGVSAPEHEIDALWDFLIRVSAGFLFLLLIVSYATGEEFQHTHALIGYSLIALILVALWWELFRSHQSRYLDSIFHPPGVRKLLRAAGNAVQSNRATTGILVMTILAMAGAMGAVA